jgi:hypothetical protein
MVPQPGGIHRAQLKSVLQVPTKKLVQAGVGRLRAESRPGGEQGNDSKKPKRREIKTNTIAFHTRYCSGILEMHLRLAENK